MTTRLYFVWFLSVILAFMARQRPNDQGAPAPRFPIFDSDI
jgi:hypothetical protein